MFEGLTIFRYFKKYFQYFKNVYLQGCQKLFYLMFKKVTIFITLKDYR